MSKHTKGPWEAKNHHIYCEDTNIHIADICRARDGDWSPANAKLIAASPELLEACKEAKRMYDEIQPKGGWQSVDDLLTDAITKAEA